MVLFDWIVKTEPYLLASWIIGTRIMKQIIVSHNDLCTFKTSIFRSVWESDWCCRNAKTLQEMWKFKYFMHISINYNSSVRSLFVLFIFTIFCCYAILTCTTLFFKSRYLLTLNLIHFYSSFSLSYNLWSKCTICNQILTLKGQQKRSLTRLLMKRGKQPIFCVVKMSYLASVT